MRFRPPGALIPAGVAHIQQVSKDTVGPVHFPHADHYRPKATDLLFDRHRARWPGMRFAGSSLIDKEKPLALGVFESERLPPVFDEDAAIGQPLVRQTLRPPLQCRGSTDPKSGPNDALRAAQFGSGRPVKKGQISAGAPFPICVKEMIRGNIVLIHRLLYKAHSEHIRVKCVVGPGIRRDRRQMMDAMKLHPSKLHHPTEYCSRLRHGEFSPRRICRRTTTTQCASTWRELQAGL